MGRHGYSHDHDPEAGASVEPAQASGRGALAWDVDARGDEQALAPWDRTVSLRAPRRPAVVWGRRGLALLFLITLGVVGFRLSEAGSQSGELKPLASLASPGVASPSSVGSREPSEPGPAASADARPVEPVPEAQAVDAQPQGKVWVHVVGAVKRAGLYELPSGARANDALKKAGGATASADLSAVNLAAQVQDGQQLRIPRKGEAAEAVSPEASGSGGAASPGTRPGAAATVRINSASGVELETLPGVGPALAQRLMQWRSEHGRFRNAADLDAVPGIGPAMLAKLKPVVSYD